MASGNAASDDALEGGIEERFRTFGRSSGLFTSWDKIVSETILSWYSALTKKELEVCKWAFYTMHDLHSGNSAMYDELVSRLMPIDREFLIGDEKVVEKRSSLFTNEEEIHKTIAVLVSRDILRDVSEIWKFGSSDGWREENIRVLRFKRGGLYKELVSASNENFIRCTDAYFGPQRKPRG